MEAGTLAREAAEAAEALECMTWAQSRAREASARTCVERLGRWRAEQAHVRWAFALWATVWRATRRRRWFAFDNGLRCQLRP